MLNIMTKPADQIVVRDIEELIASRTPEGQQLEFKEDLPTNNIHGDRWHKDQKEIGEKARNEILKEVVAFANAEGGILLLGVKESSDKPSRGIEIKPLPSCFELADRFKMKLRDCVEPEIPKAEVIGVPFKGGSDSGIVVFRVGQSRLAPHWVKPTRVCTVRKADSCESMSMRAIQDKTLDVSRGIQRFDERLRERLQDRSEKFLQELNHLKTPDESFGIRFTALPVDEDVQFDSVFQKEELFTKWCPVFEKNGDQWRALENPPHGYPPQDPQFWRPMVRATRNETETLSGGSFMFSYQELHCDGMLELVYLSCNHGYMANQKSNIPMYLDPDWPFILFANTVNWANHLRASSSALMTEYRLQVEIQYKGVIPVYVAKFNPNFLNLQLLLNPPKLSSSKILPAYTLGVETPPSILLQTFYQDFWNWLGKHGETEFVVGEK